MRVKTLIIASMTIISLLPFTGCEQPESATGPEATPAYSSSASSAEIQRPTAVESAIALSDKYAKLSEEASSLRQQKQALETEKRKLADDLQSCRSQLEQAQKELSEVNDLLVKMRLELNSWKSDVLGFRDEMRDAEKAQLEALLKILKLLGGETRTETAESAQPSGASTTENIPASEEQK